MGKRYWHLYRIFLLLMALVYIPAFLNHAQYGFGKAESGIPVTKHIWLYTATFSCVVQDASGEIYVNGETIAAKIHEDESVSFFHLDRYAPCWFQIQDGEIVITSEHTGYYFSSDGAYLREDEPLYYKGELKKSDNPVKRGNTIYKTKGNALFTYVVAFDADTGENERILFWSIRKNIGEAVQLILSVPIVIIGVLLALLTPKRFTPKSRRRRTTSDSSSDSGQHSSDE